MPGGFGRIVGVTNASDSLWGRFREKIIFWQSPTMMKWMAYHLKKYGLRADDMFDPLADADIAEALHRLPNEVVMARNQRLKRAIDLSLKNDQLPYHLQDLQTPLNFYLQPMLIRVKYERDERMALGVPMHYQGFVDDWRKQYK
eukprot:TRINITY_DN2591_c1_g1_i1.p3 TRINITY_DN2591_c1_g1~~TRINITY_DN2591_c1_g1_i1.p3  ORF type:complete len:144 (-),score=10.86 TRINITY_DN2591_c1_g1_i1:225-656(-)